MNDINLIVTQAIEAAFHDHLERYHSKHTKRFFKPCAMEVTSYAKSIGFQLDGQKFVDFYESKGWLVGKTPMKNWQAAVRTWKQKQGMEVQVQKKTKLWPIPGKNCRCGMPAVYKASSGGFDHYYCSQHMPESVKEMYE